MTRATHGLSFQIEQSYVRSACSTGHTDRASTRSRSLTHVSTRPLGSAYGSTRPNRPRMRPWTRFSLAAMRQTSTMLGLFVQALRLRWISSLNDIYLHVGP